MSTPYGSTANQHQAFLNTRHFASLDGLRCLAILMVLWYHAGSNIYPSRTFGPYGVALFFAISGFLITTLLLRERDQFGDISLKKFFIRRSLRIFPLYYTVLLLYIILVFLLRRDTPHGQAFFQNLPAFLTYTSNWFVELPKDQIVIFYFAWSLATEEQFYLIWPWFEKYLKRGWQIPLILLILTIVILAQFELLTPFIPSDSLAHTIILSIMPPICLGVIFAHLLHHPRSFTILFHILGRRAASLIILTATTIIFINKPAAKLLIDACLTLFTISCVIREDHFLAPILKLKPLCWVGIVSYGLYLTHMLTYNVIKIILIKLNINIPVISFIATTLAAVAFASLSYIYYESIFLRLKKKYGRLSA